MIREHMLHCPFELQRLVSGAEKVERACRRSRIQYGFQVRGENRECHDQGQQAFQQRLRLARTHSVVIVHGTCRVFLLQLLLRWSRFPVSPCRSNWPAARRWTHVKSIKQQKASAMFGEGSGSFPRHDIRSFH